jgi:hypothetical protein
LEAGFCFRLQIKKGGRGQKAYLMGPLLELASDLDKIDNISCLTHTANTSTFLFWFNVFKLLRLLDIPNIFNLY